MEKTWVSGLSLSERKMQCFIICCVSRLPLDFAGYRRLLLDVTLSII